MPARLATSATDSRDRPRISATSMVASRIRSPIASSDEPMVDTLTINVKLSTPPFTSGPLVDELLDRRGQGLLEVDELRPRRRDDDPHHRPVQRPDLGLPLDPLLR